VEGGARRQGGLCQRSRSGQSRAQELIESVFLALFVTRENQVRVRASHTKSLFGTYISSSYSSWGTGEYPVPPPQSAASKWFMHDRPPILTGPPQSARSWLHTSATSAPSRPTTSPLLEFGPSKWQKFQNVLWLLILYHFIGLWGCTPT
jgi:hypothetical protein